MNDDSTHISENAPADTGPAFRERAPRPWVSYFSIIVCIGIFLGLAVQSDAESWDTLSLFGYLPADLIWDGAYWGLVTSAFVHISFLHLAFNVYWLWVLGTRLERAVGSLPFLAFFVISAWISSSFQLAASGDTGIGASGVLYAFFGFMWLTRNRYPGFDKVLDAQTVRFFIIWLFGCIIVTHFNILKIGNAAHISGLLFGVAAAGGFGANFKPRLMVSGVTVLTILSFVPLFWCPWSSVWLRYKAYTAHVAKQYDTALDHYTKLIHKDPENALAYLNRSFVYHSIGQPEKAQADLQRARKIDPSIENNE